MSLTHTCKRCKKDFKPLSKHNRICPNCSRKYAFDGTDKDKNFGDYPVEIQERIKCKCGYEQGENATNCSYCRAESEAETLGEFEK